jgi:hypothetical protein
MKESSGVGEGASQEALRKQKARVIKAGTLTGLLVAAVALAANIFFVEVKEYKQLKGTLTIEVDRGSDGVIDETQTIDNLIVNSGENWLVDSWQNLVEPETMIYHNAGISAAATAEGDIGLGTELTTQLNPDNTRSSCAVVGEGASANIRRCQATVTVDATVAITEWGLFNQASTAGGTMFSRVVFAAINLNSGDSCQFTWDMTVE